MRHKKKGRKLGRKIGNRKALLMNLACQLITHKKIKTTDPKAKELRSFIEPLITIAKKNNLHSRRLVIKKIPKKSWHKMDTGLMEQQTLLEKVKSYR